MAASTERPFQGHRNPPDPSRRRRQGDRPRQVRRRLLRSRGCCTARCCAARTPTRSIKSINVDKALKLPGRQGDRHRGRSSRSPSARSSRSASWRSTCTTCRCNILARGKVLYDGHAIAAVAATSPHIAEEALRLIEVDYEVLPPVMTVEDAMEPGAPILLPDAAQQGRRPDKQTNVAAHIQFKRGDVEAGFARPTMWSSASSTPRWCIRGISSRTTRSASTTPTATPPSTARPRAPSTCAR